MNCIFVSDLHGNTKKLKKLFQVIKKETPESVFIGGDILPNQVSLKRDIYDFLEKELFSPIRKIRNCKKNKTRFFVILGNDDPRIFEKYFIDADEKKLINYVNEKNVAYKDLFITGYSYVPPTPFQLKDWEKYDVSRFVDVGTLSPEKGKRTVKTDINKVRFSTIAEDLEKLSKKSLPHKTIYLFHSPPYKSNLDRASLDGKKVDHAPVDVHVGSIAIKRFIEKKKPLLTLHGHVHETVSLTGRWREKIGNTFCFSASHDGPELCLIKFNTKNLKYASRELVNL